MWLVLACARTPEPPVPTEAPVAVAPAPPPLPEPPPAPIDPCDVPERALECLAERVAARPAGCPDETCLPRCVDHPAEPSCAAAVPRFRAACDAKDGVACRALAHQLPLEARPEVLWRGCDADDGASCLYLAELVAGGAPMPKASRGDVNWLREQACDLQLSYACAPHRW